MCKSDNFKKVFRQVAILWVSSGLLGLGYNAIVPYGIPYFPPADYWNPDVPDEWDYGLAQVVEVVEQGAGTIIDVRSPEQYAQGHLPFAELLPIERLSDRSLGKPELLEFFPNDELIVLYCGGGTCHDSLKAAEILQEWGFTNLKVYAGGLEEWVAAGQSVEVQEHHVE